MREVPIPLRSAEPPRPEGPETTAIEDPPQSAEIARAGSSDRDPAAALRDSAPSAARQKRARRRWDRYDYIGAAILAFLVALWVVHFSLPTLPPDNVPDSNQPFERN